MLASVPLATSAELFVSVRCVNRMGLEAETASFLELGTALRRAGELDLMPIGKAQALCSFSRTRTLLR